MNTKTLRQVLMLVFGLGFTMTASAQSAWVSDQFEVMLRTGPSTNNAIQLQVDSGTELEILGEDAEAGYTQVRTRGGTEGWVLSRYLMGEPSAREQLVTLTQQLTDATSDSSGLGSQLSALRGEFDSASRQIRELEQDKTSLQQQLDDITEKAADTLAIDRQNQNLQQQLTDAEIQVSLLQQENEDLSGQTTRNWFITGALVLFGGVLLGLVLPRMKFQRRSRYDSF
ncbi:MAG: TIGR04211 family SH3 domain-containing protein [Woeseiaceae bacterium]